MNWLSEYVFLLLLLFVIRAAGDMLEWLLTGMTECLWLQERYQLRHHHQTLHSECLHPAALLRLCVFSVSPPPFSHLPFGLISASLFLLSPPWKAILEVWLIVVSCNSSKMQMCFREEEIWSLWLIHTSGKFSSSRENKKDVPLKKKKSFQTGITKLNRKRYWIQSTGFRSSKHLIHQKVTIGYEINYSRCIAYPARKWNSRPPLRDKYSLFWFAWGQAPFLLP